jgi:hypothetical protein
MEGPLVRALALGLARGEGWLCTPLVAANSKANLNDCNKRLNELMNVKLLLFAHETL